MGVFARLGLLVSAAAVAGVVCAAAGAAETRHDAHGTTLLDGRKVFPIVLAKGPERGSETPTGEDALDEVVAAGVNFFKVGPATTAWSDADLDDALAWNDEAAKRGVHTWINLSTLSQALPGTTQHARLEDVVNALEIGRATGMWKGRDEPFWSKIQPDALQFAYCLSTSRGEPPWCEGEAPLDDDHLWVTIQAPKGTAADLAPYTAVTDTHGIDHYPVTWADRFDPDLDEVGAWTRTIRSVTPNQAVWTTLQVCASGSNDPTTGEFVLPTRQQERYMIYDAIINGARSLAFYGGNIFRCWSERDEALGWNWTFWDTVLEELVREINAVSPIASALVNPGSTQVLTSSDPTVQVISRRGATPDDVWVIAARSGAGSEEVSIGGLPVGVTNGTVYTEGRAVTATDGSFRDSFDRWDVHVYHFVVAPPPPPPAPPAQPPPVEPPPAAPPPPPAVLQRAPTRLLVAATSAPPRAVAGRRFSFRLRVVTDTGERVVGGAVRCAARVGSEWLKPLAKGWSRGAAVCTWKLPRSARGQRLRGTVRVQSRGLLLVRPFARRVARAE